MKQWESSFADHRAIPAPNAAMQLLDPLIALPVEMTRKSGYLPVRPIRE